MSILIYKCPQCGAPLTFDSKTQRMNCQFCRGSFDESAVKSQEVSGREEPTQADYETPASWQQKAEQSTQPSIQQDLSQEEDFRGYRCPDCGAEVLTDANTAATFCSFCHNPTIIPQRLDGVYRPSYVIPFAVSKEQAGEIYKNSLRKKPLLPRYFHNTAVLEKLTGIYVPFWLYDCNAWGGLQAKAKTVHSHIEGDYRVTRTDHYHVIREGQASFSGIPADGSKKMDDRAMDALEPFDYSKIRPFDMSYLSGYFGEKYDIDAAGVFPRIQQRVSGAMHGMLQETITGFTGYTVSQEQYALPQSRAAYALLPVWLLNVKYHGEFLSFMINGQSGKIVGDLPMSKQRIAAWFCGIAAVVGILLYGGLSLL